ncbi:hypothetical protein Nepgr_017257 [Nepenthes gracilis]|uniref:Protein kinase domain-containing protein n=1 Tax=Nepenthes gracilis TaxID=150966 RepID=A0AAD3SRP6_NEPGR|nr:hypothetical protein Nepgr_017257 [Nepenthes gracilis]
MRKMNDCWTINRLWRWLVVVLISLMNQKLLLSWSLNDEGMALLRFRDRVVTDPFGALSSWGENIGETDPCSWFGVECADGNVVSLNLRDLCLQGILAPELGCLTHAKSIILRNNSFSGVIPEEIGELKELEMLDLGYNNFSGQLPPQLAITLSVLLLDNNGILHCMSPELEELKMVSEVQIDKNYLPDAVKELPYEMKTEASGATAENWKASPFTWIRHIATAEDPVHRRALISVRRLRGKNISASPPSPPSKSPSSQPSVSSSSPPSQSPPSKKKSPPSESSSSPSQSPSKNKSPRSKSSSSPSQSPPPKKKSPPSESSSSPSQSPPSKSKSPPSESSSSPSQSPPSKKKSLVTAKSPPPHSPKKAESPSSHEPLPPSPISVRSAASNTTAPSSKNYKSHVAVIVPATIGGFMVLASALGIFFCRSNKISTVRPWATGLSGQLQKVFVTGVPKLKRSELETACEDFSNVIGSSSVGTMYKGTLSNGVEIAVMSFVLASTKDWSKNLETHFRKKVDTLSKVNHKNFVNLLGYCEEDQHFTRMMVFEYAPSGTLSEHLHIREAEHLDWGMRLRIAMGIAYCLEHMHRLNPPIAHRNLTSSCVNLSEDYAAKISDFGFSDDVIAGTSPTSTNLSNTSSADLEDDVYRFGVVLLEMITGWVPYSMDNGSLEDWTSDYLMGTRTLQEMIDPTLGFYDVEQLERIDEVIRSCVLNNPPAIEEVTARLREITGINPGGAAPKLSPLWWAELEIQSVDGS